MAEDNPELEGKAIDVTITSSTFAKVANYFVAVQIDKGAKLRTEVSAGTEKPKFKKSKHRLELGTSLDVDTQSVLTLGAFVVLPSKTGGKGAARLLGSVQYKLSEACVRLVRGETVPEDLTFVRNAGPDRKIPVGKISISLSLYGVGDDLVAGASGKYARLINVIVHSARNVSNQFARDKQNGEQASTMMEARIITKEHESLIQKLNVSTVTGLDGDDVELRQALSKEMPERLAETRVKRNDPNPKFDEIMTVSCLDKDSQDGALLRLDLVQDGVDTPWPSTGGFSVPVDDIMAGHQYDLRVDCGTFKLDGKKITQSLFVSIWARDSPNVEQQALKFAPQSSRLEVMVKGFDDTWPFQVERLVACANVYTEEAYAKIKMDLSKISNGDLDTEIPIPSFGLLPLNDVGSGPSLQPVKENNTRDNNLLNTLSKCTPVISPLKGAPRFDHRFLFNIGLRGTPGVNHYPDKGLPAAVVFYYFRQNTIEPFGGARAEFLGNDVPCKFCGFSVLELPKDHPEDGTPQPFLKKHITLLPPGGATTGQHRDGPGMRVVTRYWSGETFLRHMKEGDPLKDSKASGGAVNWTVVSADVHHYETLKNISKTKNLSGMAKAVADEALLEAKESGNKRDDDDDPFGLLGGGGGSNQSNPSISQKKNTPSPPNYPPTNDRNVSNEEAELARLEQSLSSQSKMIPANSGMTNDQIQAQQKAIQQTLASNTATEREVAQLHKRLAVITEDITHKQNLIDRLLKEVDKRSEAIRTCGVEIVQLRRQNKQLEGERNDAQRALKEMQAQESREVEELAKNVDTIQSATPQELARQLVSLSAKYKAERERNNQMLLKLKKLYQQASEVRHSKAHYEKLEKAHQAQAQYIQKLQQENQKIEVYKATIRTQEKVVAKLEELIESKLRGRKGDANSTTFRLKQEVARLTERNNELEKKLFAGGADGTIAVERVQELEEQLRQLRARGGMRAALNHEGSAETHMQKDSAISALEAQLVENAKGFAKQISDLKIQVMEAANGGDSDEDDF